MKNRIFLFSLLLGVLFAACGTDSNNDSEQSFLNLYGREPYMGTSSLRILRPGETSGIAESGEGSIQFVDQDDSTVLFLFFWDGGDDEALSLSVNGSSNGSAWQGDEFYDLGIPFDVNENKNGEITGGGSTDSLEIQFAGTIIETRIEGMIEITPLVETEHWPAGTTFRFNNYLVRDANNGDGAQCDDTTDIVWEQQWVADLSGDGGELIMVPRCR